MRAQQSICSAYAVQEDIEMNKLAIKEALRKARYQNRKETGKRYMTKGQLHQVMEGVKSLEIPKEKNARGLGVQSIGDILNG